MNQDQVISKLQDMLTSMRMQSQWERAAVLVEAIQLLSASAQQAQPVDGCTEENCRRCRTPKELRTPDMYHAGLSAAADIADEVCGQSRNHLFRSGAKVVAGAIRSAVPVPSASPDTVGVILEMREQAREARQSDPDAGIFADHAYADLLDEWANRLERHDSRMSGLVRDYIEGMSVSIDVSTGEHDAGNRYYGFVSEVMDDPDDKHGVTLLVQDDVRPNFKVSASPAALTAGDQQTLKLIYDAMSMGTGARTLANLLACIENVKHHADCIDAVEREFFMVPGEPNEDDPDSEPGDECLLNRWGSTVEQYVEQFRSAIPHLLAASPVALTETAGITKAEVLRVGVEVGLIDRVMDGGDYFTFADHEVMTPRLIKLIEAFRAAPAPQSHLQQWSEVINQLPVSREEQPTPSAPPAGQVGWQPIETAPKDREVWAFNGEQGRMQWSEGSADNGEGWALWVWCDPLLSDADPEPEQPTHFMPLPADPVAAMGASKEGA